MGIKERIVTTTHFHPLPLFLPDFYRVRYTNKLKQKIEARPEDGETDLRAF